MNRLSFRSDAAALVAALCFAGQSWAFEPDPFFFPNPPPEDAAAVIIRGGPAKGSYLGVGVAEITTERAKALKLLEERGVEVTRVEENSPAEKGGLKTGDVVIQYNDERVEGLEQFMRMVRETPPGRDVKLTVSRSGATQQLTVTTGARKLAGLRGGEAIEIPRFTMPEIRMPDVPRANMSWRSVVLGIEAESLDGQLAQFFGVTNGVLVRSVIGGSTAEKAGVKAGDVIVKVDDRAVSSPREITAAIRSGRSKKAVTLTVMRDKREMSLNVALDDAGPESRVPARNISVP